MRNPALLAIGSLLLVACGARFETVPTSSTSAAIDATIASATLANDCGESRSSGAFAGDCAAESPGCGGCQQSTVVLALTSSANSKSSITVAEIHLLDATTGARLDDGVARNARVWTGAQYNPWDGGLAPGASANVLYDMSQFDWTKIGGGNSWNTYSRRYKLEVVLRVDGDARTLVSGELSREPEVVT